MLTQRQAPVSKTTHQSDPANRARLRWRSRRGLLENDIILTRLLDLADNPLMDLILARREPEGDVDLPHVRALLARLQQA